MLCLKIDGKQKSGVKGIINIRNKFKGRFEMNILKVNFKDILLTIHLNVTLLKVFKTYDK